MEIVNLGNISFLKSNKINIPHGFSLRHGGVSEGEFDSLNVGLRRGDNPFNAFKNIEICADGLKLNKKSLTMTYQLHTDNVRLVTREDIGKGLIYPWDEGVDGIITKEKNVPLMCYSADCVPILLYEPDSKIIGAVHGGWRGTKAEIVKKAIELMEKAGGKCENIIALIGPAIGKCCYEVSEDVGMEFYDLYSSFVTKKENGKYMLDLKAITFAQLTESGLKKENIDMTNICTMCENDTFFSHRGGNGKSGLLGGFIQLI